MEFCYACDSIMKMQCKVCETLLCETAYCENNANRGALIDVDDEYVCICYDCCKQILEECDLD